MFTYAVPPPPGSLASCVCTGGLARGSRSLFDRPDGPVDVGEAGVVGGVVEGVDRDGHVGHRARARVAHGDAMRTGLASVCTAGKLAPTRLIVKVADGSPEFCALLPQPLISAAAREQHGARRSVPRARRGRDTEESPPPPHDRATIPARMRRRVGCEEAGGRVERSSRGTPMRHRVEYPSASSDTGGRGMQRWFAASPTGHSSRAKNLLEEVGDMMILTGRTICLRPAPALPLRRRVRLAVPVRAAPRAGFRCWSRRWPSATARPGCRRPTSSLFGALDRLGGFFVLPRSARSGPASPRSCSPAWRARRSPPTSARARSARSSTRCRCSASTRSRTSSCRASWR